MDSEPDKPEAQPKPPARTPAARKPSTPRTPAAPKTPRSAGSAASSGAKPPVKTPAKAPARPATKTAANARPAAAKKPAAPRKTAAKPAAVEDAVAAPVEQPVSEESAQSPTPPPPPASSTRPTAAKSAAARKAQAARLAEVIKRAEATRVVNEATIVVEETTVADAPAVEDAPVVDETPVVETPAASEAEDEVDETTVVVERPKPATPARKPAAKRAPARKPPASAVPPRPPVADVDDSPVVVEETPVEPTAVEPAVVEEPVVEEPVVDEPVVVATIEEPVVEAVAAESEPGSQLDTVVVEPATAVVLADAEEREVVLQISGLVKRFDDTTAVAGIDLSILAGSFFGIVGPNGAGKTTTLSMVTGLLKPDAGTVSVHGANVWSNPVAAKRTMGVLPDRLRLFDRLTGAQLLFYSGVLHGLEKSVVRSRTSDLAAAFGLEDSLDRLVSDYSAGMTKKIAIAAAMIHSPRLLVFDEPFESVDPVSAANIIEILQKYVAAGGTVVISSHTMNLIERVCDSVAVVVNGAVLATGTMEQVRAGKTLEERFVDLAGGRKAAEGMEWLHKFSD